MCNRYCSNCGHVNDSDSVYCVNCNGLLMNENIKYADVIKSFDDFLCEDNLDILKNTKFTPKTYFYILGEIESMAKSIKVDEEQTTLERIYAIADEYVKIYAKHKGSALGYYYKNEMHIDERLPESEQITTIIHELTHHLFAELFEQWMMYTYNVEKNSKLEAIVSCILINPLNKLANEFVAHSTEGQFTLHGAQNYGSFIQIMQDNKIDLKKNVSYVSFGNALSNDFTQLLSAFIDKELRKDIIEQFKEDNIQARYDQIRFEEFPTMHKDEEKVEFMKSILVKGMESLIKGERRELLEELEADFI